MFYIFTSLLRVEVLFRSHLKYYMSLQISVLAPISSSLAELFSTIFGVKRPKHKWEYVTLLFWTFCLSAYHFCIKASFHFMIQILLSSSTSSDLPVSSWISGVSTIPKTHVLIESTWILGPPGISSSCPPSPVPNLRFFILINKLWSQSLLVLHFPYP